jgi:protein-S-isoprenylcysteine O-methyltransferase Ste14
MNSNPSVSAAGALAGDGSLDGPRRSLPARVLGLAYGVTAYILAVAFWPVFIIFIGDLPRLKEPLFGFSVSSAPVVLPTLEALAIDVALIAAFALHHSILARPAMKLIWGRHIPRNLQRATFVHIANAFAFALVIFWQPIPIVLWHFAEYDVVAPSLLLPVFFLGWLMLLVGAMSFNLAALFGLRQAWAWYKGVPYQPIDITKGWIYQRARHPEFLGVFIGVWTTAHMTVGHALLAGSFTLYSLLALKRNETELEQALGPSYSDYRRRVPMLGPSWLVALAVAHFAVSTALAGYNTIGERSRDAQAIADLARLQGALEDYYRRRGAYPANPAPGRLACSGPPADERFLAVLAELDAGKGPIGPPGRPSPGYCYYNYQAGNELGAVIGTVLEAAPPSNTGLPGSCRPHTANRWCEDYPASRIYCLCLPH